MSDPVSTSRESLIREFGDLRRRDRRGGAYTPQQQEARRQFARLYDRAVGELMRRHGWFKSRTGSHGEWYLRRGPAATRRAIGLHITPADWVLMLAFKFPPLAVRPLASPRLRQTCKATASALHDPPLSSPKSLSIPFKPDTAEIATCGLTNKD